MHGMNILNENENLQLPQIWALALQMCEAVL